MSDPRQVAIVCQFLAHYRAAVLRELLEHGEHRYFLMADMDDPAHDGIRAWRDFDPQRFMYAPARFLPGGVLVQRGLLRLALRRDVKTIIYTGDVHYASTWLSAILARLNGKRVLFWTMGWSREERGLKDVIRRAFYRLAQGLLLYGRFAKSQALNRGFHPDRLYVVYNSLDYREQRRLRGTLKAEDLAKARSSLFENPDRPLLICVSRLARKRRLDLVLDAMSLLRRDGVETNLLLVGEGPERAGLEANAAQQNLTVHFFGECYDERTLATLVSAADLTVAPGMVGLTAMQSLAYDTPVVTHDDWSKQMPEWEAIVPGKSGCLFRFGDSADLARAIRECSQHFRSNSAARQDCHDVIERFYNPSYQRRVIDQAVAGAPADDLMSLREIAQMSAVMPTMLDG